MDLGGISYANKFESYVWSQKYLLDAVFRPCCLATSFWSLLAWSKINGTSWITYTCFDIFSFFNNLQHFLLEKTFWPFGFTGIIEPNLPFIYGVFYGDNSRLNGRVLVWKSGMRGVTRLLADFVCCCLPCLGFWKNGNQARRLLARKLRSGCFFFTGINVHYTHLYQYTIAIRQLQFQ